MGNSKTKDYSQDTFFNSSQIKLLSIHFNSIFPKAKLDWATIEKLFRVKDDPDLHTAMGNRLESQVKNPKDFEGFLKSVEYLIFGKNKIGGALSYDTKGPIERLADLLNINEQTSDFNVLLLRHLLSICAGDLNLIVLINPNAQSVRQFQTHCSIQFPVLANCLPNFLHSKLLDRSPLQPPEIDEINKDINEALPFLYLSCPTLIGIKLVKLYLSKEDGLSFNRVAAGLNGYEGSMILTIRLSDSTILGAFIGEGLRDNAKYSGSMDTFLFTFANGYRTFRPEEGEGAGNFIYFNSKISGAKKFPKGLGFGGTLPDIARL